MEKKKVSIQALVESIIPESFKAAKCFAVMLFQQGWEIGDESPENARRFFNTRNFVFTDPSAALAYYSNIPCPASQLIEASNPDELVARMESRIRDFQDPVFIEELLECL